jgi:lipopolysaccharide export system protein LptC
MTRLNDLWGRLRAWLPLIPLLLLLAGTYWLNQQVQPPGPKSDDRKRHDVDFSVENLASITLDENGHARHMMTTEKMWHYPDDDSTYLDHPHFISIHDKSPPTIISAVTGKVSSHGDEVFLYNEVTVIRLAEFERDKLNFSTEYLHVLPNQDQADTDRPVTIITERDTINATGMTLNNKLQTANLLSNVRATHVPPVR